MNKYKLLGFALYIVPVFACLFWYDLKLFLIIVAFLMADEAEKKLRKLY
jgi:hypothetical protein